MLTRRRLICLALVGAALVSSVPAAMAARHLYRQRYSSWSYYPSRSYYYSYYYYQPYSGYDGYRSHYCVYYPSTPRYVYYYNPYASAYWGRYDLEEKGYSLLAEKDRKGDLKQIPESAFPKPGQMPLIPESDGKDKEMTRMDPPNLANLPKADAAK
jgi:hypothetical protein